MDNSQLRGNNQERCSLSFFLASGRLHRRTNAICSRTELGAPERFARNLDAFGAVVRPFGGDIEYARTGVLDKNCKPEQLEEVGKTPVLLMIGTDFDHFDHQDNPWILFNFGSRMYEGVPGAYRFRELLSSITSAVADEGVAPFEVDPPCTI